MAEFIVLTLPRSRSSWMTQFLSFEGRTVGHDIAAECDDILEYTGQLAELDGVVETGAAIGWKVLRSRFPLARFVIVFRPLAEIEQSLGQLGITGLRAELETREQLLMAAATAMPRALVLSFAQLDTELGAKRLFEHCLGVPFDVQWWIRWRSVNVQIDVQEELAAIAARQPQLAAFRAEVMAESRRLPVQGLQ